MIKSNIKEISTDVAICGKEKIIVFDSDGSIREQKEAEDCINKGETYSANANYTSYKKKQGNSYSDYWTRSVDRSDEEDVLIITYDGMRWYTAMDSSKGVVPAFRIG